MGFSLPSMDSTQWPESESTQGFKSTKHIFCPKIRAWPSMVAVCYSCPFGYNGQCDALSNEVVNNPEILEELYLPVLEFHSLPLKKQLIFNEGKFYDLEHLDKFIGRGPIHLVRDKYQILFRFVPRFTILETYPPKGWSFVTPSNPSIFSYQDVLLTLKSNDIVFSLSQDPDVLAYLEVMGKK